MNCPSCDGVTGVLETRKSQSRIRRRRSCACGMKFTTLEIIVPDHPQFSGDLRLISVSDLKRVVSDLDRVRRLIDRLTLTDSSWVVQADLEAEKLE